MKGLLESCALSALIIGCAVPAAAQQAAAPQPEQTAPVVGQPDSPAEADESKSNSGEVVVTGTLIRGVAPIGTNVTGLSEKQIKNTGYANINQVLRTLPQVSSASGGGGFNNVPSSPTSYAITNYRAQVRTFGGLSGTNTTLVLIDGHNVVGAGVGTTSPDVAALAPAALARVEIVADGGSSLYGSDAVGGVINYITKKSQNGFELSGHVGLSEAGYTSRDLNGSFGTRWGSGSAFLALGYRANSDLRNRDLPYARADLRPYGGSDFRVTTCSPSTVSVGATTYAAPGFVAGTANRCDPALSSDIVPSERQLSAFGSFTQELSDRLTFDLTGLWTHRVTTQHGGLRTSTQTVRNSNFYFRSLTGETSQSVGFSLGMGANTRLVFDQFGVTPVLTVKLGGDWQAKAMFNYGWSKTTYQLPGVDPTLLVTSLAGTTAATALNPYDPLTSDGALLSRLFNYESYQRGRQTLTEGKIILDGPLFSLPGGEVKLAVGADYQRQTTNSLSTQGPIGDRSAGRTVGIGSRNVAAVFGELSVPLFSAANATTLFQALTLNGSIRYDHYNDFGDTVNPKIGLSWMPVKGIVFRGNYSTAFNAPSLQDASAAFDTRADISSTSFGVGNLLGYTGANLLRPSILIAGGRTGLQPQTAKSYSFGADLSPSFASGLKLGATYWRVKLENQITVVPPGFPASVLNPQLRSLFFIENPTLAQALAVTDGIRINGTSTIAALYAGGTPPLFIFDLRRRNLGSFKIDGIDGYLSYDHPTSWGSLFASLNGTYYLNRVTNVPGLPTIDSNARDIGRFTASAIAGIQYRRFFASATLLLSEGYDITPIAASPSGYVQTHVKSFHPVNLSLRYNIGKSTLLDDMNLTLNVDNVGDIRPPFYNGIGGVALANGQGYANGSTLGRYFNIGLDIKF